MFQFLKRKPPPEGPVSFHAAVDVERPADAVYALIDWADARNAKRELGHRVEAVAGRTDLFQLELAEMPGTRFEMLVSEAEPNRSYRFATDIRPRVGRLEASEEHYRIEALGEGRCRLSLEVIATFAEGLSMWQYERELVLMTISCTRAVAKLKVHAEEGAGAVGNLEDRLRRELI
jgi:hypothetical protein